MRIFTVTYANKPIAVVRARNATDAIDTARDLVDPRLARRLDQEDLFDTREPDDAEMVRWLETREDIVLVVDEAA